MEGEREGGREGGEGGGGIAKERKANRTNEKQKKDYGPKRAAAAAAAQTENGDGGAAVDRYRRREFAARSVSRSRKRLASKMGRKGCANSQARFMQPRVHLWTANMHRVR